MHNTFWTNNDDGHPAAYKIIKCPSTLVNKLVTRVSAPLFIARHMRATWSSFNFQNLKEKYINVFKKIISNISLTCNN